MTSDTTPEQAELVTVPRAVLRRLRMILMAVEHSPFWASTREACPDLASDLRIMLATAEAHRQSVVIKGSVPVSGTPAPAAPALAEEIIATILNHRPDASFDDSAAGHVEREALKANIASEVRILLARAAPALAEVDLGWITETIRQGFLKRQYWVEIASAIIAEATRRSTGGQP